MRSHILAFVIATSIVVAISGCGGGGGGNTTAPSANPSSSNYELNSSPSGIDTSLVTGRAESATSTYTVSSLSDPTNSEANQLLALDDGMFSGTARISDRAAYSTGVSCTPVSSNESDYSQFFSVIVAYYNSYRNNSSWPSSLSNLPAAYRTSKSSGDNSYLNIFECAEDNWNVLAGYRTVVVPDGLIKVLDEATDLLFLVDTAEEYDYYLRRIVRQHLVYGRHNQVVSESLHNSLTLHPTYGPQSAEAFAEALAFVVSHEIGHLSMGHALQKLRLMNNQGVSYKNVLLSYAHEFQADIYAAHTLNVGNMRPMGLLVMHILEIAEEYSGYDSPSITHPPTSYRRYIVDQTAQSKISPNVLVPIHTVARPAQSLAVPPHPVDFRGLRKTIR